jgi:MFS family permease
MALTVQVGGWAVDKIGARVPVFIGASVMAVATIPLAFIDGTTPTWWIATALFIGGLGNGLCMMPSTIAGMNSVPSSGIAQASAWRSLSRQLAAAVGIALLTAVLSIAAGPGGELALGNDVAYDGFRVLYLVTAAFVGIAALVGLTLPGREQALALQAERRREGVLAGAFAEVD